MKFRLKRPENLIDAVKFTGENFDELRVLVGADKKLRFDGNGRLSVGNREFFVPANIGDWIAVSESGTVQVMPSGYINTYYEETEDGPRLVSPLLEQVVTAMVNLDVLEEQPVGDLLRALRGEQ